ncbi:sterol carrier family protein [Leucobacter sp. HY1910]
MARRRISDEDGLAALAIVRAAGSASSATGAVGAGSAGGAPRATVATAVRYLLEELAAIAPGNTVEVRVPPFGATQCVEGPRHTRGTPPNVIEMSPDTWLGLATGSLSWDDAVSAARVVASGSRATLEGLLPVMRARD